MSRAAVRFLVYVTLGLALALAGLGWLTAPSNLLGAFLLLSGLTYFFGVIVVYWVRRIQFWRAGADETVRREERGDRSFWLTTVGMIAAFYLPPLEYLLASPVLPRGPGMEIAGLVASLSGSVLLVWARRELGAFYSGHLAVVAGQPLVEGGPYRFLRHPAYAGYLLIALGLAVGYSSAAGAAAVLLVLLPSLLFRMRVEDRLLAEHFGPRFRDYARRTKRLLPGIW